MNILRRGGSQGRPRRVVLPVEADSHGGHKSGLLNPDVELHEETPEGDLVSYTPELTPVQEVLWDIRTENVAAVTDLIGDDDGVYLHNGDLNQGNKYPSQLVSTRMADQIEIGVANLSPWLEVENIKVARIIFSTDSHGFGEGSSDILVANSLKRMYPHKDIKAIHHGLANIGGELVDYSHHGPYPGSRIWLKGNVARYYLRDLMMRHIMAGREPPKLVIRSHYHEYIEEMLTIKANGRFYTSYLVVTPSMQMMSDFARQATRSADHVTNGMVVFEIVEGHLQWPPHRLMRSFDIRTKEDL